MKEICDYCHIGEVVERMLTYTERLEDELILIPNIPGMVCTYCGEKRFDPLAMNILRRLLWARTPEARGSRSYMGKYSYRIGLRTSLNKGQSPSRGN